MDTALNHMASFFPMFILWLGTSCSCSILVKVSEIPIIFISAVKSIHLYHIEFFLERSDYQDIEILKDMPHFFRLHILKKYTLQN